MANSLYRRAVQAFSSWTSAGLSGPIDLADDAVFAALVSSNHTPDLAGHQFVSDLAAYRLGSDQAFPSASVSAGGAFKSGNPAWATTPATGVVGYVAIYKRDGPDSASPLIALLDTASINGGAAGPISYPLNGGSITLLVDPSAGNFTISA